MLMHCAQTQAFELTHCVLAQVLGIDSALLEKTTYIVELRAPQWPHIPIFSRKKYEDGKYDDKNEKVFFPKQGANQSEKMQLQRSTDGDLSEWG